MHQPTTTSNGSLVQTNWTYSDVYHTETTPAVVDEIGATVLNPDSTIAVDITDASTVKFYFLLFCVIFGVLGSFANGTILFLLVFAKHSKKLVNVLLINQLSIDFYSCLALIITYTFDLFEITLTGPVGWWLCKFLPRELLLWMGLNSSSINLAVITTERYVKIVHSVWHKNHFKPWMAYAGCALAWFSGIFMNVMYYFLTADSIDGVCVAYAIWQNPNDATVFGIFYYIYYFQLPVVMFVYCYGRILLVIRRQNRIFNSAIQQQPHNGGVPDVSKKASRAQMSALKTSVMLTAFFVVSWLPNDVYFVVSLAVNYLDWTLWYALTLLAYVNICANPFIYVISHDDVRSNLLKKFPCLERALRGAGKTENTAGVKIVSVTEQTA